MNPIQDFINSTSPSVGGFLKNAASDVGNVAKGIIHLPQTALQIGKEVVGDTIKKDQNGNISLGLGRSPTLQNIVKGTASEYNDLLGKPVRVDENGRFSVGLPDLNQAASHAYQHPVQTALDVLPFVGGMKGVAPAEEAAATSVKAAPAVSDVAANTFLKSFTIPRALKVNAQNAAKFLINDGTNLEHLQPVLDVIEKVKRAALGDADQAGARVSLNEVPNISENLSKIPQLAGKPAKVNGYVNELSSMLPQGTADDIMGASPLETYDSIKNIEQQGYAYKDAARDAAGNMKSPMYDKISKVYLDTAESLKNELDKVLNQTESVKPYLSHPDIVNEIGGISSKLLDRFQNGVKNWTDLRSIQKPYLDMQKIVDYTDRAGHTAFANLSGGATRAIAGTTAGAIGSAVGGVPGAIAGGLVGSLAEPFLAEAANKFLPPVTGAIARNVGSVPGAIKSGLMSTIPLTAQQVNQNPTQQSTDYSTGNGESNVSGQGGNDNSLNHGANNTISSGRYQVSQSPQGFLTGSDYNSQVNDLTQKIANLSITDPIQAESLKGQLSSLQNTWNSQQPIRDAVTNAQRTTSIGNSTYNLINKADPSILNLNGSFDKLLKSTNPAYAALGAALQEIQNETKVDLSHAGTKEALIAALDQAMAVQSAQVDSLMKQFYGGTGQPKSLPATPPSFPTPSTPNDYSAITGGSLPPVQMPQF